MLYKVTERVEDEYGRSNYNKIANVLEPFGIMSFVGIVVAFICFMLRSMISAFN